MGLKLTRGRRICILPGLKVTHQRTGPLEVGFQLVGFASLPVFLCRDLARLTIARGSEDQGLGHLLCPKDMGSWKGIVCLEPQGVGLAGFRPCAFSILWLRLLY